jgi:hypothetical protein
MWYELTVSACVLDTLLLLIRIHVTLSRRVCECVCADVVAGANERAFSSLVPGPHRITRHDCRARHVASDLVTRVRTVSPQHTRSYRAKSERPSLLGNSHSRTLPRVDTRPFGVALGALTGWAGVAHWVDRATGPSWHHGGTCLMQRKPCNIHSSISF